MPLDDPTAALASADPLRCSKATPDGFAIFKSIADHRDVFSAVKSVVNQTAQKILVTTVKSSALTLSRLADIRRAVGGEEFGLLLDNLSAADLKRIHYLLWRRSNARWPLYFGRSPALRCTLGSMTWLTG